MHELGLLRGVVAAVERAASEAGDPVVTAVALRVGTMSGAVPDALLGAWPLATHGTAIADARLEVESIAAAVWCPRCATAQPIGAFFALTCPACDTPTGELVAGREFEVAWVEWEAQDSHSSST